MKRYLDSILFLHFFAFHLLELKINIPAKWLMGCVSLCHNVPHKTLQTCSYAWLSAITLHYNSFKTKYESSKHSWRSNVLVQLHTGDPFYLLNQMKNTAIIFNAYLKWQRKRWVDKSKHELAMR